LILVSYAGTRLDRVTELSYSTYRSTADAGNNLAIALQLNVDYDVTDAAAGYQGRIVYEPYHSYGGQVVQGIWQTWNTLTGKWWGTKSTVTRNGVSTANPCVQATPCTWTQLLTAFPNAGVHATYGAVVLKAGSGWGGFQGNVDRLVIGIDGTSATFDFEQAAPVSGVLTLIPPDSTPYALFTSLGTVSGAPLNEGPFLRDIVLVEFKPGTPLQARQAAIDLVGGRVVGGKVNPDGLDGAYYVQISGGTSASLVSAVSTLQQVPSIGLATWWPLFAQDVSSYRRPIDQVDGWRDWKLDPSLSSSSRPNWALEYIRAPFAWGCSVGSRATTIAVVDHYLHINANLRGNIDSASSSMVQNQTIFGEDGHGTRVASVLSAVGNDSTGMTGTMWHSRLILRDGWAKADDPWVFAPDSEGSHFKNISDQIFAAGMQGASVINISMGNQFTKINKNKGRVFDPNNDTDEDYVRSFKGVVTQAIARLAQKGRTPLLVIAAGNDGVDARAAGTAAAKEDYPDQVLVVGGLDANGAQWAQSDTGHLVDIWAPAVGVSQAAANDAIGSTEPGTSFSAPLAAGVAGLLKDWDPSLTSADIINFIKLGARSEGGLAKLDAYGALKAAATRQGAPLCGNRVHSVASGDVVAERPGHADEILFASIDGAPYTELLNVLHGGKRIQIGDYLQFSWDLANPSSSHWTQDADISGGYHEDAGGAFLSWYDGSDHDATAHVISNSFMALGNVVLAPQLISSGFIVLKNLPQVARPMREVDGGFVCTTGPADSALVACLDPNTPRTFVGSWILPDNNPWAYAPQGDFVLQAIDYHFQSQHYAGGYDANGRLVPTDQARDTSESLELWKVDTIAGATPLQLPVADDGGTSRPGLMVEWVAINEEGTEFVWQIGKSVRDGNTGTFTCTQRVIEYRALPGHPTVQPGRLVRSAIPQPDVRNCQSFGAATFSPTRIGSPARSSSQRNRVPGAGPPPKARIRL
jgi:hypothetical protein